MEGKLNFIHALEELKSAALDDNAPAIADSLHEALDVAKVPSSKLRLTVLRDRIFEPLQLAVESCNKRLAIKAVNCLQLCVEMWSKGKYSQEAEVKLVARTTIKQVVETMTLNYGRCDSSVFESFASTDFEISSCGTYPEAAIPQVSGMSNSERSGILRGDICTVLRYLIECINVNNGALRSVSENLLYLEAVCTILRNLPTGIVRFQCFTDLVWKELCPTLVALLRPDKSMKSLVSSTWQHEGEEIGRGASAEFINHCAETESLSLIHKIVLRIAYFMGPILEMRSILESLFHCILLYPPPKDRVEALKTLKPVLSSCADLCRLTLPCWHMRPRNELDDPIYEFIPVDSFSAVGHSSLNLAPFRLIKIIVDSIKECCSSSSGCVALAGTECLLGLLNSLDRLCLNEGIAPAVSKVLASQCRNASSVFDICLDFTGPYCWSDVHEALPLSQESTPPSDVCSTHSTELVEDYISAVVRIIPKLIQQNSESELDQILLEFASNFCSSWMNKSSYSFPGSNNSCELPVSSSTFGPDGLEDIVNADAIYVTTFAALSLNLYLMSIGFYALSDAQKCPPPVTEQSFVNSVASKGMLLYLTTSFLEEVYHSVLANDYLGMAGFDLSSIHSLLSVTSRYTSGESGQLSCPIKISPVHFVSTVQSSSQINLLPGGALYAILAKFSGISVRNKPKQGILYATFGKINRPVGWKLAQCLSLVVWDPLVGALTGLLSVSGLFDLRDSSRSQRTKVNVKWDNFGSKSDVFHRFLPQTIHQNYHGILTAVTNGLACFRCAIRLGCKLLLHPKCGELIDALVYLCASSFTRDCNSSIVTVSADEDEPPVSVEDSPKSHCLHCAHVLLLDAVLSSVATNEILTVDCWRPTLRACALVLWLEHRQFAGQRSTWGNCSVAEDEINTMDVTEFVFRCVRQRLTPDQLQSLNRDQIIPGANGMLKLDETNKVVCLLSRTVDRFFDQAALSYSLPKLLEFVTALIQASGEEVTISRAEATPVCRESAPVHDQQMYVNKKYNSTYLLVSHGSNTLFDRVCQLLLCAVHDSQRPLIHLLYLWPLVSEHLIHICRSESGTPKLGTSERRDADQPLLVQRGLSCLHSCIVTLITSYPELPGFHMNEMLCRPYELSLKLELCDADLQDRIVCCICELVEATGEYIRSAWRPLFSALRSVRVNFVSPTRRFQGPSNLAPHLGFLKRLLRGFSTSRKSDEVNNQFCHSALMKVDSDDSEPEESSSARGRRIGTIMEIFEVFLSSSNMDTFCGAVVDCTLCLLHYISASQSQPVPDENRALEPCVVRKVIYVYNKSSEQIFLLSGQERALIGDEPELLPIHSLQEELDLFRDEKNDSRVSAESKTNQSLFLPALSCLIRCVYWLERLWSVSNPPQIQEIHRHFELLCGTSDFPEFINCPKNGENNDEQSRLDGSNSSVGILRLYYLIVHQLTSVVWNSSRGERNLLMDSILHLTRGSSVCFPVGCHSPVIKRRNSLDETADSLSASCGGPQFAIMLAERIVLPNLRSWLEIYFKHQSDYSRSIQHIASGPPNGELESVFIQTDKRIVNRSPDSIDETMLYNFEPDRKPPLRNAGIGSRDDQRFLRLFLGQTTDLIVEFVDRFSNVTALRATFRQYLDLISRCASHVDDPLVFLAAGCLRHLVVSFTAHPPPSPYWVDLFKCLRKIFTFTLIPLEDAMERAERDSLFDDTTFVVILPKDPPEWEHLCLVGKQLFGCATSVKNSCRDVDPSKKAPKAGSVRCHSAPNSPSKLPLITPRTRVLSETKCNPSSTETAALTGNAIEVKAHEIIRGLIANEFILRTINGLLFAQTTPEEIPEIIPMFGCHSAFKQNIQKTSDHLITEKFSSGHLACLSLRECFDLLSTLGHKYAVCVKLNHCLKVRRLLQHVLQIPSRATLLKQAGRVAMITIRILVRLILIHKPVDPGPGGIRLTSHVQLQVKPSKLSRIETLPENLNSLWPAALLDARTSDRDASVLWTLLRHCFSCLLATYAWTVYHGASPGLLSRGSNRDSPRSSSQSGHHKDRSSLQQKEYEEDLRATISSLGQALSDSLHFLLQIRLDANQQTEISNPSKGDGDQPSNALFSCLSSILNPYIDLLMHNSEDHLNSTLFQWSTYCGTNL
ncbi:unnamed protein product [Calicophoron daubneyi]|uniref:Mon2/Sec7/BIG1-like HDS domain-containing protein n=1 Tax=Calicophoron daubneyi TaxID=300641 RepID=A0AAV2TH53_CALDB